MSVAPAASSGLATNSKLNAARAFGPRMRRDSVSNFGHEISGKVLPDFPKLRCWRIGLDTEPPLVRPSPSTEGRRIHARSGRARMRLLGHRGIGVDPPG